ncbi:MAG: B12-binding domain-containing radical SAM protein [Bacteroidetes bacterium]|nr:B12-binding domain-containing radical SAM protein [Bacteroidota bacterium]
MSILLFNPRSNNYKPRIPNSVLQVAASIDAKYDWVIVDGNLEQNPIEKIEKLIVERRIKYCGFTVMPGPQLKQAIPFAKQLKEKFPNLKMIWGGYFPSNHANVVLQSGYVDFIVNGMADVAFPQLIHALEKGDSIATVPNLIYLEHEEITTNPKDGIYELDTLSPLPYTKLNELYPFQKYLGKTYLGTKTIAYHSSFGCPFTCSFCAVVPIYNARWKGKSAKLIYQDIKFLKDHFGGNAIEFHDNNFFVSEKRTTEFANLIMHDNMTWWGEGRIDTIDKYSDHSLETIRKSGCKMIFFGAETGNDKLLKMMDKGGTQTAEQIRRFANRMHQFDIIPEYSFVLGMPAPTQELVWEQIRSDIDFIKQIKDTNPDAEIIIYVYSPVPQEGSELYKSAKTEGFKFPTTLEEWISPSWENFDLRKNPLTPWLTPEMIAYIKNFETVLNGYFPTVSDYKLKSWQRNLLKTSAMWRYKSSSYAFPYEIKTLNKLFKYRQPEIEGF